MHRTLIATLVSVSTLFPAVGTADTLADVKRSDYVRCGVSDGLQGFSIQGENGEWSGFDVDFCRAVAAAVLGDAGKVKFLPLSAVNRFTALNSGEIDLLSRNTSWTMGRDTHLGINFAGISYFDSQGLMVSSSSGVSSALELEGATVCTNAGTTSEQNIVDFFRTNKMSFELIAFELREEAASGYNAGRCDVYTSDRSGLVAQRLRLSDPSAHTILPDIISKEPLGPAVRQGDDAWFNIVRWTLHAMINAEELDLTSDNITSGKKSDNPNIKRLTGTEGNFGEGLGLSATWAFDIIEQVGNYGESYEAHLGAETPINLPRAGSLNALWSEGGLIYAPPIR